MADTTALHLFVESLRGENAAWIDEVIDALGEVSIVVPREAIVDVCRTLKETHGLDLLADICGANRNRDAG